MKLQTLLAQHLDELPRAELQPVEVAVLDTGVDATHPELEGRVSSAFRMRQGGGRFQAEPVTVPSANDPLGHGTGVASVITRIAPNAKIVDLRIVESAEVGTGESLVSAFGVALQMRTPLINLSLSCHRSFLRPLSQLCEVAYQQGQVVVAARRNMPLSDNGIPAEFSSCIGVDADRFPSPFRFRFRSYHPIECTAQGEDVEVAMPGGGSSLQRGSSFATPTVTGLCALLLGAEPELEPFEVKTLLKAMVQQTAA